MYCRFMCSLRILLLVFCLSLPLALSIRSGWATPISAESVGSTGPEVHVSEPTESTTEEVELNAVVFAPLFVDNGDGKDMPVRKELNDFDKKILEVCGDFGKRINKRDILALLKDRSLSRYVQSIYDSSEHVVYGRDAVSVDRFVADLADLLDKRGGFQNIFCGYLRGYGGEKNNVKLSGPHFFARLQEIQDIGRGGLHDKQCYDTYYGGPEYTVSLRFSDADGQLLNKCPLSFVNGMHGDEILVHVVQSYKASMSAGLNSCFNLVLYAGKNIHYNFVRNMEGNAVITFYPIHEPSCSFAGSGVSCKMCS